MFPTIEHTVDRREEQHNILFLYNSDLSSTVQLNSKLLPNCDHNLSIDAWVQNVLVITAYILGRYYLCLDQKGRTQFFFECIEKSQHIIDGKVKTAILFQIDQSRHNTGIDKCAKTHYHFLNEKWERVSD